MLFVDHDQLQVRQRGQHRQPRAEHDRRAPQVRRQPVQRALAFGQAAVQGRHQHAGKARAHAGFQLRRQVDLGHQDQDLRRLAARRRPRQHARGGMQVDLGLAAAGDAIQQAGRETVGAGDGVGRRLLRRIQCGRVGSRRGSLAQPRPWPAFSAPAAAPAAWLRAGSSASRAASPRPAAAGNTRRQNRTAPATTPTAAPVRCAAPARFSACPAPARNRLRCRR